MGNSGTCQPSNDKSQIAIQNNMTKIESMPIDLSTMLTVPQNKSDQQLTIPSTTKNNIGNQNNTDNIFLSNMLNLGSKYQN
jgi:hypothetical protein